VTTSLSSGELASMVMADAIIRLLPGVIKEESYQQDSFYQGGLDHPHYTKPASYRGLEVPEVPSLRPSQENPSLARGAKTDAHQNPKTRFSDPRAGYMSKPGGGHLDSYPRKEKGPFDDRQRRAERPPRTGSKAKKNKPAKESSNQDIRTGMSSPVLAKAFSDQLLFSQCRSIEQATPHDCFVAQALTVRDRLIQRWAATQKAYNQKGVKRVFYFSAEFLMGRLLGNNLLNLGIRDAMEKSHGRVRIVSA
jgi:hypothetical protein